MLPLIGILMATYNGEKYISEQIESILGQTFTNWQLLIHDDGSTDSTPQIIKKYAQKYPDKIIFIDDGIRCGGAKENFSHLLNISIEKFNFDYIMFSDQDDVWLENKIEITLKKMLEIESKRSKNVPVLIHTDLKVVNEQLRLISNSFWDYANINPKNNTLNCLMLENTVTGCTMMINRALYVSLDGIPSEAVIHDWWIALVCSLMEGIIYPVYEAPILYRQHPRNDTGAREGSLIGVLKRFLSNPVDFISQKKLLVRKIRYQIMALYNFAVDRNIQNELINAYAGLHNNTIARKFFYLRKKCLCGNLHKKIGKFIFY